MSEQLVRVTIEGRDIAAPPGSSIIDAYLASGQPLVEQVGCMGAGLCGSCRVLVRLPDSPEVTTRLACETAIAEGMQVSFLEYFGPHHPHTYAIEDIQDSWRLLRRIGEVFPEATQCRHCGGCDRACPKEIEVQRGVILAAAGNVFAAAEVFDPCVMCNLCAIACPEHIHPNNLGMFVRRAVASLTLRPADLVLRLQQIERGEMRVDIDAPGALAPRDGG